ncbi:MAG: hypothetical protein Kow0069_36690 [Promethearchaeota archaeon]
MVVDYKAVLAKGTDVRKVVGEAMARFLGSAEQTSALFKGRSIFVKVDLPFPSGPPFSVDLRVLRAVLGVILGGNPRRVAVAAKCCRSFDVNSLAEYNGLKSLIEAVARSTSPGEDGRGYERLQFVALDASHADLAKVALSGGRSVSLPKLLLETDFYVLLAQGRNHPAWNGSPACLSAAELHPQSSAPFLGVSPTDPNGEATSAEMVAHAADALEGKLPDLVLVDCTSYAAGQGFSSFNSTVVPAGFVVVGNNAAACDWVVSAALGLASTGNELLVECAKRGLGPSSVGDVNLEGDLESAPAAVESPSLALNDPHLNPPNVSVREGGACLSCRLQARLLLDILRVPWSKDAPLFGGACFLVGWEPVKTRGGDDAGVRSELDGHVIVFGDCASRTTKGADFRQVVKERVKKNGSKVRKIKPNRRVLDVPGCPPAAFEFFRASLSHFKPRRVPFTKMFYDAMVPCRGEKK